MCLIIFNFSYRASIYPVLLLDIKKADSIIGNLVFEPNMLQNWPIINSCRFVLNLNYQ